MTAFALAASSRGDTGVILRLAEYVRRRFGSHWRALHLNEAYPESVVSHHGPVEIRQSSAGLLVQTRVKGEPDRARATAIQRIARCLSGNDRYGMPLRAAGPLVQREEAPDRWLVSIRLPDGGNVPVAAVPRKGKVRIGPTQSEYVAVVRISRYGTRRAIANGEAAIRAALVGTMWQPSVGPMLRLHCRPAILPFANRFEIALPVAIRHFATQSEYVPYPDIFGEPKDFGLSAEPQA